MELLAQRLKAGVQHSLGHRVGEQALYRLAAKKAVFRQLAVGRIGATGAHGDQLGARLPRLPPGEYVGVDLLIDEPVFAIYLVMLVTRWLLNDVGGLAAMHEINRRKAKLLYDVLDESDGFYRGHARPNGRSLMNVTFRLPDDETQNEFVKQAKARNLVELKGHRSVGGIRASIYNAMPMEGVEKLRDFMREFAKL